MCLLDIFFLVTSKSIDRYMDVKALAPSPPVFEKIFAKSPFFASNFGNSMPPVPSLFSWPPHFQIHSDVPEVKCVCQATVCRGKQTEKQKKLNQQQKTFLNKQFKMKETEQCLKMSSHERADIYNASFLCDGMRMLPQWFRKILYIKSLFSYMHA